jgi:hypothetical protein
MPNASDDFISQVCVLYDPRDGRIAHTHRSETYRGGKKKTENEMASRARECAARRGWDTAALEILHAPSGDLRTGKAYRVDPLKKNLVEIPRRHERG